MLDILQETLRYIQEQNELLNSFKSIIVEKEEQYKKLHSKICYQILEEMQKEEICKEEDEINNEEDDINNEEDDINNEEDDLNNEDEEGMMNDEDNSRILTIVKEEPLTEDYEQEELLRQQSLTDSNENNSNSNQDEVQSDGKMQVEEFPVKIKTEQDIVNQHDSVDGERGFEYEQSPETSNENSVSNNMDSIFPDEQFDDNMTVQTNYHLSEVYSNKTNNVAIERGDNLNIKNNEIISTNKWLLGNISNDHSFSYQALDDALSQTAGSSNVFASVPAEPVAQSQQTTRHQSLHKCPYCENSFHSQQEREAHIMRTHSEKPHPCSFCKMSFKRKSNLDIHMRLHTGEKPYNCEFCGMPFRQLSHLINHRRRHTGEKPFQCSICQRSFGQKSGLVYHHKRFHDSRNECPADNGTNN